MHPINPIPAPPPKSDAQKITEGQLAQLNADVRLANAKADFWECLTTIVKPIAEEIAIEVTNKMKQFREP